MINCLICNNILVEFEKNIEIYKCNYCKDHNKLQILYSPVTNSCLFYEIVNNFRKSNSFGISINFQKNETRVLLFDTLVKSYSYLFSKEEILKCFNEEEKYLKLYNLI